jgi:DNA-binding response OmpR family regulator
MAREIKSLKDDTHFIVLTAFNDNESLAEFREIGYYDYLVKPIEFTKLLAGLENAFSKSGRAGSQKVVEYQANF